MAKTIGFIGGTGPQGMGLVMRLARSGREVLVGSRSPEKGIAAAGEMNAKVGTDHIQGMSNVEVASKSDVLFVTVPFENAISTLNDLKSNFKKGMILVDVTVPLVIEKGFFTVQEESFESGAERIRKEMPEGVIVAAAFKTISAHALAELEHPMDCDDFVASDGKEAREEVMEIVKLVKNLRPVDAGVLKSCRVIERMTAFLINVNKKYKVKDSGFRVVM